MKNFFIIANAYKDIDNKMTKEIQSYIIEKGGTCEYQVFAKSPDASLAETLDIGAATECILVLGGDGTLIRAARFASKKNIPMIGVNLGHLGYLCELDHTTVYPAIDKILEDQFELEERMMIMGSALKFSTEVKKKSALNDIVIFRKGSMQLIELILHVNGEFLNLYHCDGMIVSTPTGSTGYSMSAGGPILDPKSKMIVLTPINEHNLNAKSIVLSADDIITIELGSRGQDRNEEADISFDGDQIITLQVGDKIEIRRSDRNTKIVKLSRVSFLEILRKKMQRYS
ncbi:MAG: NAD(+)/NADH kinase [Lachnospiraceae bacterium]